MSRLYYVFLICFSLLFLSCKTLQEQEKPSQEEAIQLQERPLQKPMEKPTRNVEIKKKPNTKEETVSSKPQKSNYPQTAPTKDKTQTKEKPPEKPFIPMDRGMLLYHAGNISNTTTTPLQKGGEILSFYHDLNGDKISDIAFISFKLQDNAKTTNHTLKTFEVLNDYTRIFKENTAEIEFYLEVYLQQKDKTIHSLEPIFLTSKKAIEEIKTIHIRNNTSLPIAIVCTFPHSDGTDKIFTVFSNNNTVNHYRFTETSSTRIETVDINNDGVLDIIRSQNAFEEGSGYETFLTLYEYTKEGTYTKTKSTNIVRNLRSFIGECRALLLEEEWNKFLIHSLPEQYTKKIHTESVNTEEIYQKLFKPISFQNNGPQKIEDHFPFIREKIGIKEVIFPQILENPFKSPLSKEYCFPIKSKIVSEAGNANFYTSFLAMAENPFSEKQFFFNIKD